MPIKKEDVCCSICTVWGYNSLSLGSILKKTTLYLIYPLKVHFSTLEWQYFSLRYYYELLRVNMVQSCPFKDTATVTLYSFCNPKGTLDSCCTPKGKILAKCVVMVTCSRTCQFKSVEFQYETREFAMHKFCWIM